jgi:ParB-like chromosome segregation protein Spo0J
MIRVDSPESVRSARRCATNEAIASAAGASVSVPCADALLAARELLSANTYNPNHVSPDKMALLERSIRDNGFCFPIVTIWDDENERLVIVDGFHRYLVSGPDYLGMSHVPVVVLTHTVAQRMAATVQFNKARGVHQVDLDADVVKALLGQGLSDEEVAERLGLELDAVHRYKSIAGVAALFAKADYSIAWEMCGP